MFDNKIHNWCCFSDIESKFPEMWNDSTEAKKACNYCEKQYDMIEKSLLIVLDYYKHGKLPAELEKALAVALDCMGETEGIYQDYYRALKNRRN